MGRVNYGRWLRDRKGMVGMSFGNQLHFGWDMYPLPMDNLDKLEFKAIDGEEIGAPVFLRGYLDIEGEPADTFVRLDGFKKGFVVVNGFNIGRYFNLAGPQRTLYLPAPMLKTGRNEIVVFESDGTDTLAVEFFDKPDLG
jgi:beta-galactosidase